MELQHIVTHFCTEDLPGSSVPQTSTGHGEEVEPDLSLSLNEVDSLRAMKNVTTSGFFFFFSFCTLILLGSMVLSGILHHNTGRRCIKKHFFIEPFIYKYI